MLATALAAILLQQTPAPYKATRYDMGIRLQMMDEAWLRSSRSLQKEAVPHINTAVLSFFGGGYGTACESLDKATAILSIAKLLPKNALTFRPVDPFYESDGEIRFTANWAYMPEDSQRFKIQLTRKAFEFTPGIPLEVTDDPFESGFHPQTDLVSFMYPHPVYANYIPNWKKIESAIPNMKEPTAKRLAEQVQKMAKTPESWSRFLPLGDWLGMALDLESAKVKLADLKEIPFVEHQSIPFRIAFPEKVKPDTDVVIALHGAGGDYDMFFESYGRGICARLAKENGMLFASPSSTAKSPAAVLDWLKTVRGIEPKRVFLMGHSMGGGMVLGAATSLPKPPDAILLFAPAAASIPASLEKVPTYLAVGKQELAMLRRNADAMGKSLAGRKDARYEQVDNCEHLMIVASIAEHAFTWLKEWR